jgi:hypothetical protein
LRRGRQELQDDILSCIKNGNGGKNGKEQDEIAQRREKEISTHGYGKAETQQGLQKPYSHKEIRETETRLEASDDFDVSRSHTDQTSDRTVMGE